MAVFFMAVLMLSSSAFPWTAGSLTVDVVNSPMNIKVSAGTKTLLEVSGINFGAASYSTVTSVTPTTDSLVINLSAGIAVTIKPVFSGIHMYGKVNSASTVMITMKDQGDHFFGITEQNIYGNSPDLRGHSVAITAGNIQNYANEFNAKVWSAFYMSSLGYGSFFNTFAEGTYVFGSAGGVTSITHNTNTLDWYIYFGPTGDKIHQAYFKTIAILEGLPATRSPTKKVPIWACGLTIWHDNYSGSGQVLSHVTNFTANQIPLTSQWIDRPYSDGGNGWGSMNFSSAFANPATWIRQISSDTGYNVKMMTWVAPLTFGTPVPPAGTCFNGGFYYLDLSNPAAVAWYKSKLEPLQYAVGVQGHKMDRCEETFTEVMNGNWSDGTPTTEKQPKYLYLNAKVTDELLRAHWGDDNFNFPRGTYHRSQPYINAVWAGDTRGPWAGLVGALANGIKTAFCGYPNWGSDIGGYMNGSTKIPKDQYLRWLAMGCFCGYMENMLDGKEPYNYTAAGDMVDGASFVSRYKSIVDVRMSLIPYTYSLVNTSADNGTSIRPLPYMYPDDANTYSIGDEYMYGPALLVAPITSAAMTRSVYLPAGTWYYFFDQTETHAAGAFTTPSIPLYQIPVYVKSNSIYLTGQIYPGNSKRWITNYDATRKLVINATPGAAGESTTFTYVDYLASDAKKAISLGVAANNAIRVQSPAMTIPGTVKVHLGSTPVSVNLNGVALTSAQYQYAGQILQVPFAAGQAVDLQINGPATGTIVHENPKVLGQLHVRANANGIELLVPPAVGLHTGSRIEVRLFDMRGKLVWENALAANRICSSAYPMSVGRIGKGSYCATVEIDGVVALRGKVIVSHW